jgi:two-component system, NarL family, response regulator NreC
MLARGAEQPKARILIVDDHAIVRHGMVQLANQQLDVEVCHEADSADAALAVLQQHELDLVIVDASLAGVSGLELVARIKAAQPKLPVLLLALLDDSLSLERALRAGANGYVLKQEPTETLVHAIRKVLSGGVFLSEKMQHVVLQYYLSGARGASTSIVDALSPREFEVFQLIGQGFGTSLIAAKLARSVKTIEAHRATIKQKLGLKSGIELTQFAAGWVRQRE